MKYKCFECGTTECIQHHHVVPRSVGGTKTIPLCSICHGRVHGIKRTKQINISELTKAGLARAKAMGVRLGGIRGDGLIKGRATITKNSDDYAQNMKTIIEPMRQAGMGYGKICKALNDAGFPTRRGGKWHKTSVRNLIVRLEKLEEK